MDATSAPTLQDIQVAGRVLHFQKTSPSGTIVVALIYNATDLASQTEAAALMALLGSGLAVGDLVLRPVLIEQSHLADAGQYEAIFATTGVDGRLLNAGLRQHQVPCITRHIEQVEHGACTVAIRSLPSVSIVVSQENAVMAGVRFATAFRMMVQEI